MTQPSSTASRPSRTRAVLVGLATVTAITALGAAACVPTPSGGGSTTTTSTPPTTAPPACGTGTPASATTAAGGTVTVTPATNLCQTGQTVTVSGSGWSTTANGGLGFYVAYGPAVTNFWTDASLFASAKWVHPGATPSAGQDVLRPDGTFSTTVSVPARFTNSAGNVDCAQTACRIYTMTAHGLPDRSQDSATAVSFHS